MKLNEVASWKTDEDVKKLTPVLCKSLEPPNFFFFASKETDFLIIYLHQ